MASNERRIARRMPVIRDGKPAYDYGIFEAQGGYGTRQLVAVIEDATYKDATTFLGSDRTESGHSVKGFKKLKAA